jgi:hypothetical protein
MYIILDSNIYAADYRMNGVAFQSLFEYMRRSESKLVLPRVVREEVVVSYGRRLKSEAKAFEEAWRRYRHVDIADHVPTFRKPDGKYEMTQLRRKLMSPMAGMKPIYVQEITGGFLQEAFMRGVHRTRPANDDGEELRDVILWLWALAYADSVDGEVAFVSNDGGFWAPEGRHPDIDRDLRAKNGRLHLHRSILELLKGHSPAKTVASPEWIEQHFQIQTIERELIDRASQEIDKALRGYRFGLAVEHFNVKAATVYEVSATAQFAELQLQLVFKFQAQMVVDAPARPGFLKQFGGKGFGGLNPALGIPFGWTEPTNYLANVNRLLSQHQVSEPVETAMRELTCDAEAEISLRIKDGQTTEVAVDELKIDRAKLYSLAFTFK